MVNIVNIEFEIGDRVLVRNIATNEVSFGTFLNASYDCKNCVYGVSIGNAIKKVDNGFSIKTVAYIPLDKNISICFQSDEQVEAYNKMIQALKAL